MRNVWLSVLGVSLFVAVGSAAGGELVLAENGRARTAIVVDAEATPTVHFAALELKRHLETSTGAAFALVTNALDGAAVQPTIEVGTRRARELTGAEGLDREESVTEVRDDALLIAGSSDAGVLYGVYAFLERAVGCRWYTQTGVNRIPRHPHLAVPTGTWRETPAYPYRWILTADRLSCCRPPHGKLWLLRNRLNMVEMNWEWMPPGLGLPQHGQLPMALKVVNPTVHSLSFIIKKEELKTHPDWFTLDENGRRVFRQLCFSNPELRQTFTERMLAHIERNGGKGYFDCSSRDEPGRYCTCPGCTELEKKYGCTGGPFYDYLLALADVVKAKYPEAYIHFLAYRKQQTQKPPQGVAKLPDNLIVVFAPIDDNQFKPWSHPDNAETYADLQKWTAMAKHVFGWYYPQTFVHYVPQCSLSRLAADTRLARLAGMDGGCYEHDSGTDEGIGFADLISWVIAKLYWNPDADVWALAKDYCEGCYGAAAAEMLAYAHELDDAALASPDFVRWDEFDSKIVSVDNLARWSQTFDVMERKVADDPAVLQRVREVRLPVDLHVLQRWHKIRRAHPEAVTTPETVRDRMSATLAQSFALRFAKVEGDWYVRTVGDMKKGWASKVDDAYLRASHPRKPLPPAFEAIPEGDRREFYPDRMVAMEKMDDAALGFAMHEKRSEESHRTKPFSFGVFDYGPVTRPLIARTVTKEEIVPDEFHLYKVGRTAIPSAKCRYWNSVSWFMRASLTDAFQFGGDFEYDVYASLKFEGPAYSDRSQKEKSDVFLDRVVLIKAKK